MAETEKLTMTCDCGLRWENDDLWEYLAEKCLLHYAVTVSSKRPHKI